MKSLRDCIVESTEFDEDFYTEDDELVMEGKVTDEKSFREWAESKFKEVYGDEYDEDKMKKAVDGLLNDNKKLVEDGEWGELVGMMNKSFAPESKESNKE